MFFAAFPGFAVAVGVPVPVTGLDSTIAPTTSACVDSKSERSSVVFFVADLVPDGHGANRLSELVHLSELVCLSEVVRLSK